MTRFFAKKNLRSAACQSAGPIRLTSSAPASLVEIVKMAGQEMEEHWLQPLDADCASLAFQPRVMLGALVYCYARQIYGSFEIQKIMTQEARFRDLCGDQFPDARDIQHFREQNLAAIQSCLTTALLFLARQKIASGLVTRVNETYIAEEARRRITMAVFIDQMALENQDRLSQAG